MSYYVGVDIGGTNMVCGLLDEELELIGQSKIATESQKGPVDVVLRLAQQIDQLLHRQGAGREELAAIGVGVPGMINPAQGIVSFAGNLGFTDLPLAEMLMQQLGKPVIVDNDVRMYAYGELLKGAGQGAECLLATTLGTGISASVISNGRLFYGSSYMAGEIGHIPIAGEITPCVCGLTGCLETVASATGMARQAEEALSSGVVSVLQDMKASKGAVTAAMITEAYDQGDALAERIFEHTGKVLARGLSCVIPMVSPDVIVIGGGVAQAGERLFGPLHQELGQLVYRGYLERLTIRTGALIDTGGVIGSAALARQKLGFLN